jgi:hypothetical protein
VTSLATSPAGRSDGISGGSEIKLVVSRESSITRGRGGVRTGGSPTEIGSTGMMRGTLSAAGGSAGGRGKNSIALPFRIPAADPLAAA